MKSICSFLSLVLVPVLASAADIQSDYATALRLAKETDKPVLAYFCSGDAKDVTQKLSDVSELSHQYVILVADKTTAEGEKLFHKFEIESDHGCVVVERSQQWQYCRYQRQLNDGELKTVLKKASRAIGKPVSDLLHADYQISMPSSTSSYCPNCRNR